MSSTEPAAAEPRASARVFFEGRYRKLVRDLPQTIFYCPECRGRGCPRCEGFGKLTKDSVQELIARTAMPVFRAPRHAHKFHGAGREDVDVRMLGRGRPFVFEIDKAREHRPDLLELQRSINERCAGRLELLDLRWCERRRVPEVKEEQHAKDYGLRVRVAHPTDLAALRALVGQRVVLRQRTPERVAHRRADLERERWIELRSIEPFETDASGAATRFALELRSEHGTYIKEAVSGDEGRTQPSIAGWLGAPCVCEELDVLDLVDEAAPQPAFGAGALPPE
jgi:tRNA pseudouridine synthase 10